MGLPAGVSYRKLQVSDFPLLQRMLPPLLPGDWSVTVLQQLLISTHHCRVLCSAADEAEDAVLGFAEFTTLIDECELLNLAIDPEVQGCGLGRTLLRCVLEEVRGLGCTRSFLEVRRSNDAAIALYASEGFSLDGVRKAYYPPRSEGGSAEDALLYSLVLRP